MDAGDDVDRFEDTLQNARSELNFAFGYDLPMAPGDMLMRIDRGIAGYNNEIQVADPEKVSIIGLNPGLNAGIQPPAEPDDSPPQDTEPEPGPNAPSETDPPLSGQTESSQISRHEVTANHHEDEKTALVIAGVAVGVIGLWMARR